MEQYSPCKFCFVVFCGVSRRKKLSLEWGGWCTILCLERAKIMLHDLKVARTIQKVSSNGHKPKWSFKRRKPSEVRLKCNIDVSFSKWSNKVGISMCNRDNQFTIVLVKTKWFSHVCVHVGEALGLLYALE